MPASPRRVHYRSRSGGGFPDGMVGQQRHRAHGFNGHDQVPATVGMVLDRVSHGRTRRVFEVDEHHGSRLANRHGHGRAPGGTVGDDIMLTAMFLPAFRSEEEFVASGTITVGTYGACEGDSLVFPFMSNMSGFDTGVALINNSTLTASASCRGTARSRKTDDDVQERDKMDVDAKDQTVFILSMANPGPGTSERGVRVLRCLRLCLHHRYRIRQRRTGLLAGSEVVI